MDTPSRTPLIAGFVVLAVLALSALFYLGGVEGVTPLPQGGTVRGGENGLVTIMLKQTGLIGEVKITPIEIVEDSRCPKDVQCIQAGTVRVRATLQSGLGTTDQVFLLGEPVTTEAEAVTLVTVQPDKVSTFIPKNADYRLTFKIEDRRLTYDNASADLIAVTAPPPGAVVGKEFKVTGRARGNWYFEASFPIDVLDKNGKKLTTVVAQAQGEWMTTEFVPFSADVTVPASYSGPATVVLNKDNPSGLPEHDASLSYDITIEY